MFNVREDVGGLFLEELARRVDVAELTALRGVGGFGPPNYFDVERMVTPLREGRFPEQDHFEYQWALYECGYDLLARLSGWVKLYLAALYLYCGKKHAWSMNLDSDYCFLVIEDELNHGTSDRSKEMLRFVEWLVCWVSPGYDGYEPYHLLLSWTMLRELRGDAEQRVFDQVMSALDQTDWEAVGPDNGEQGVASWLDLRRRIPFRYGYSQEQYEWLIRAGRLASE